MSTPKNPIVRAIAGVATMGMSEVPAQLKTGVDTVKGVVSGNAKPLDAVKSYGKGGSPTDSLMPKMPSFEMPTMSPSASPSGAPESSPAATLRKRRAFSTILTGPGGLSNDPSLSVKQTLLGGGASSLGR